MRNTSGALTFICAKFCEQFEAQRAALALELTWQMGRPARYAAGEITGMLDRARYMIGIAAEALAAVDPGPKAGLALCHRHPPLSRSAQRRTSAPPALHRRTGNLCAAMF